MKVHECVHEMYQNSQLLGMPVKNITNCEQVKGLMSFGRKMEILSEDEAMLLYSGNATSKKTIITKPVS